MIIQHSSHLFSYWFLVYMCKVLYEKKHKVSYKNSQPIIRAARERDDGARQLHHGRLDVAPHRQPGECVVVWRAAAPHAVVCGRRRHVAGGGEAAPAHAGMQAARERLATTSRAKVRASARCRRRAPNKSSSVGSSRSTCISFHHAAPLYRRRSSGVRWPSECPRRRRRNRRTNPRRRRRCRCRSQTSARDVEPRKSGGDGGHRSCPFGPCECRKNLDIVLTSTEYSKSDRHRFPQHTTHTKTNVALHTALGKKNKGESRGRRRCARRGPPPSS